MANPDGLWKVSDRSDRHSPCSILEAGNGSWHRIRGFQYQADAYMTKPYDLQELTEQALSLCAITPAGS